MSAKMALPPGQCASSSAASWLVADPHLNQVVAGADHGPQRLGLRGVAGHNPQPMRAQPQILRDHQGVAGVGLRPGHHLTLAPGLDRVRGDRHHRMPGLEQQVHQPAVRSFDPDLDIERVAEPGQLGDQTGDAVGGMLHGELAHGAAFGIEHAHSVGCGGPIETDEELSRGQGHDNSSRWQRRPGGNEADARVVTNRRSAALLPLADPQPRESRGRWCHAGPRRATSQDRHPGSRRVPTTSTETMPARRMVP